tara:strand:+ start:24 stop:359 length:336 start_codon:yes stop_codon:yes gene_type:complete
MKGSYSLLSSSTRPAPIAVTLEFAKRPKKIHGCDIMKEILALENEISILTSKLERGEGVEAKLKKAIKKLKKRVNKLKLMQEKNKELQEGHSEYFHLNQKTDYEKRRDRND